MIHKKRTFLLSAKVGTNSLNYEHYQTPWSCTFICDNNENGNQPVFSPFFERKQSNADNLVEEVFFSSNSSENEIDAENQDDCWLNEVSKSEFLTEFKKTFELINAGSKWRLSDGTIVEDKMYEFGARCAFEHLCHSWILDTYIKHKVFTPQQLEEIISFKPANIPDITQEDEDTLRKFADITTAQDLRKLLATRDFYNDYDPQKHDKIDWIYRTLDNMLPLYEKKCFKKTNNKRWYQNHLWSMIDRLLGTSDAISVVW